MRRPVLVRNSVRQRWPAGLGGHAPVLAELMPATTPGTTPAGRRVASGTALSEPQRYALAELINVLHTTWDDLPAEVQTAYRQAITALT